MRQQIPPTDRRAVAMTYDEIQRLSEHIYEASEFVERIINEISKVIVGQRYLIERLLVGLLADGHILVEGVPGLAKTMAVRCLAETLDAKFQRIQFTPDLLPADISGRWFTTNGRELSRQRRDRFSPTSSSPMKSTGRLRKFNQRSLKRCRSAKSHRRANFQT
jgi:MoxR-like ATPases